MMDKQLKRGDIVRRSILGAKGFFYPDTSGKAIMIREDCTAKKQVGWNDCSDYNAYHVPSTVFAVKDRYDSSTENMVVWVKKNG
jgi:hypothetical protein